MAMVAIVACSAPAARQVPAPQVPAPQVLAPRPSAAQAEASDEWREIFDAAGWPDITAATRVTVRPPCVGGWLVRTPRGPMVVFDDLHVEWGTTLWEHWPEAQRVPIDRYDDVAHLHPFRRARAGGSRRSPGRALVASASAFLGQIARPDCAAPVAASNRLFWVARARWAEMLGHPEVAMAQREREAWAFAEEDELRNEMARVLMEGARGGLSRGMSRREARTWLGRARSIVRDSDLARVLDETLETLGDDAPPWSASPTIDELAVALADEPSFPFRRWDDDAMRPRWATGGALQLASPGWELVMRGWDALPALRDAARSTQSTRPFRNTSPGVGSIALDVAAAIAGRTFDDADALDGWWLAVGHRGRSVALRTAIAEPHGHAAVEAIVRTLVREGDPLVWPVVARAVGDPAHPRRAAVLAGVADALEREAGEPGAPKPDRARARRLANAHLHDEALDVRLASISVLLAQGDAPARRAATTRLTREARAGTLGDSDAQDEWWSLLDDLHDRNPGAARRVLRAAAAGQPADLRDTARDVLAERANVDE